MLIINIKVLSLSFFLYVQNELCRYKTCLLILF
uniref:Uncharacterized protein n=1 Tax=Amphimedon queenslandica TaxID=400682 RepID=A0A1X7TDD4_AMPQE